MNAETGNARGDVRGLVAKLAAHVRPTCSELWDEAQAFLAAEGVQAEPKAEARGVVDEELSHADLCRLSRVFNAHNVPGLDQDRRINEWLGKRIAESLTGERNG